jgi:hypothetical protein
MNVVDKLDLFPAHVDYEDVQSALKDATMGRPGSQRTSSSRC